MLVALGIGANVAILGILERVFDSRPFADDDRLVVVENIGPYHIGPQEIEKPELSWPDFQDLESQHGAFSRVGGVGSADQTVWDPGGRARSVKRMFVTPHLMTLLGARARVGRILGEADFEPGAPAVAVVTEGLWRRQMGSDLEAVGRNVRIDGLPFTVVGIVADEAVGSLRERTRLFEEPDTKECVVVASVAGAGGRREPLLAARRANRGLPALTVVGRLRTGVTMAAAQEEVRTIGRRLARAYPVTNGGRGARALPWAEWRVRQVSHLRPLLLVAAVLVLLAACASAVGLVATDAIRREPEMAVRHALGASRVRLFRLVVWRVLRGAVPGGAVGLVLAIAIQRLVDQSSGTVGAAVRLLLAPGWLTGVTILTAFVAVILGGVAASTFRQRNLSRTLADAGHSVSPSRRRRRALGLVVGSQVTVATSLGLVAALFGRSMANILSVDLGFHAGQAFVVPVFLPEEHYRTPDERSEFFNGMLGRVRTLPGVASAALSDAPPLSRVTVTIGGLSLQLPDQPRIALPPQVGQQVTPGYFEATGMTVTRGRAFSDEDERSSAPAVVVDEAFCRAWLGNVDPLQASLRADGTLLRIVGVVQQVRQAGPLEGTWATLYFRRGQIRSNATFTHLVVQPSGPTREVMEKAVGAIGVDPRVVVDEPQTLRSLFTRSIADRSRTLRLLVIAASIALVLTTFSVAGALGEFVESRMREIGLRKALGATRSGAALLVCRAVGIPCVGGIVVGGFAGWFLARLLSSELFGLEPGDPATLLATLAGEVVLGVVAAAGPLRRAIGIDPVSVLRSL